MTRDGLGVRSGLGLSWGAFALASVGVAGVITVAIIVYTRRFDLLVPKDHFFAPKDLPRDVSQMFARRAIEKITAIASVAAGSAVVLAVGAIVRARRQPPSLASRLALASIVLGVSALPAALYVRFVAALALTPWAFG
jgi:hypothetical protein